MMQWIREFAAGPFEWSEHFAFGLFELRGIEIGWGRAAGKFSGGFSCAAAEDEEIGERISAETVGTVEARRGFACGEQAGNGGCGGFGFDADAAHHVMTSGA